MDTPLPDDIRQSLLPFIESLGADHQTEAMELLLLAIAATYAAAERRGTPPPEWVAKLPGYPPQVADVRRLVEEMREVMGSSGPRADRFIAAAESILADLESAPPEAGE